MQGKAEQQGASMLGKRDKTAVSPTRDGAEMAARLQNDDEPEAAQLVRPVAKRSSIDGSRQVQTDQDQGAPAALPAPSHVGQEDSRMTRQVISVVKTLMNSNSRSTKGRLWLDQTTTDDQPGRTEHHPVLDSFPS